MMGMHRRGSIPYHIFKMSTYELEGGMVLDGYWYLLLEYETELSQQQDEPGKNESRAIAIP